MVDIYMGDTCVGHAEIEQKGLYYHISCSCNPPSKEIHRIIMCSEGVRKDLGICVPKGNEFYLFARVPIKQFGGNNFSFELTNSETVGYAVAENMPFAHLDKLETARLQQTSGQSTIIIDPIPNLQDSGRNQERPNK